MKQDVEPAHGATGGLSASAYQAGRSVMSGHRRDTYKARY